MALFDVVVEVLGPTPRAHRPLRARPVRQQVREWVQPRSDFLLNPVALEKCGLQRFVRLVADVEAEQRRMAPEIFHRGPHAVGVARRHAGRITFV